MILVALLEYFSNHLLLEKRERSCINCVTSPGRIMLSVMPVDMLLSESYLLLRTTSWIIQVDTIVLVCFIVHLLPFYAIVVFLADLIVSHIPEDELRSWATINRGAFVLTRYFHTLTHKLNNS